MVRGWARCHPDFRETARTRRHRALKPVVRRITWTIILLGAAAAVVIYLDYRDDLDAARARVLEQSRLADTPCGPIEYALAGAGPPVLVVHGAGGGFDQGLLIAEDVVRQGFRAIAVSRFGYLRSPLPQDASSEAQADALACLLDALGLERAVLLGASAGAPSALQMAIRHPGRVSALILLVPATFLPDAAGAGADVPRGLELIFATALRWDFPFWAASRIARNSLIRAMLGTPPELLDTASAGDRDRVSRMLDYVLPVKARREGLLNDGYVTTTMRRPAFEKIKAPTLVVSAEDDLYGTFERGRYTAAEIAGARFIGFPSGGHMLVGRQDEITREVINWLRARD